MKADELIELGEQVLATLGQKEVPFSVVDELLERRAMLIATLSSSVLVSGSALLAQDRAIVQRAKARRDAFQHGLRFAQAGGPERKPTSMYLDLRS